MRSSRTCPSLKAISSASGRGRCCGKKSRNYFISTFLSTALKAVAPYVTVWLSARIIAELAGGRDAGVLTRWVILTLAVEALLALAAGLTLRWKNVESLALRPAGNHIYAEKMLDLEYPDVDRQAVYDLYSQIRQRDNWQGWGDPLHPHHLRAGGRGRLPDAGRHRPVGHPVCPDGAGRQPPCLSQQPFKRPRHAGADAPHLAGFGRLLRQEELLLYPYAGGCPLRQPAVQLLVQRDRRRPETGPRPADV